jgi:hypothetical protein
VAAENQEEKNFSFSGFSSTEEIPEERRNLTLLHVRFLLSATKTEGARAAHVYSSFLPYL